jgi:hypothetical protein
LYSRRHQLVCQVLAQEAPPRSREDRAAQCREKILAQVEGNIHTQMPGMQSVFGVNHTHIGLKGTEAALKRYENARKERTARVQIGSCGNEWLKEGGNADWVYGYVASTAPLEPLH